MQRQYFTADGKKIAFYLSPIGSAIASECLLEANWLTGDVLSDDGYSVGSLNDANHNTDHFRLALEIAKRV